MLALRPHPKIQPEHLDRQAFVYVRQSTLLQVREHTASTARQYDLVQRAQDLGWPATRIQLLDQDQGRSGSSTAGRDGFQTLVAAVGLGQAGAVFCLEASRLARACSDWYRLLELCALSHTLVIDEDGIYDPDQYNDRLLLGFKGTMSEAELHWLRQRLLGGKLEKAQHGQLRCRLPVGLVYDPVGRVVLDPDEQVQQAVRLLFARFDQGGSALAVVQAFHREGLLFPSRGWGGAHADELGWHPLHHGRVLAVLHNPTYAGAYVYGRTRTRTHCRPGEAPRVKGRTRQVVPTEWPVVIQDAHPAYLSWDQFLRNQERLTDNRTNAASSPRGAVREGAALLQGIVRCGRCGRRMSVRYHHQRPVPTYECNQARKQQAGKACQSLGGERVDAAVAQLLLEAMQPAQLQLALAALERLEAQAQQVERQGQLRVERARYEAELARRRFCAVEPEHRLVARSLERDWNEKLAECDRLEREAAHRPPDPLAHVGPEERERILALAHDLPALWQASTTTQAERKQLLRFLIKDVTLRKEGPVIQVGVRWQTDATTLLEVRRAPSAWEGRQTAPAVIARIRELATTHPDRQIAAVLNQEGFTSGTGGAFTARKVQWLRYTHALPTCCPEAPGVLAPRDGEEPAPRGDGRYSAQAAAAVLNVDVSTVAAWCKSGRLDGVQAVAHGPWWVRLTPEQIAALRKGRRQRWGRNTKEDRPAV